MKINVNKLDILITYAILLVISLCIFIALWYLFELAWLIVAVYPIIIMIYFQSLLLVDWGSATWKILRFCSAWYVRYFGDSCGYYIIFLPEVTGAAAVCFIIGFLASMIISPIIYLKHSLFFKIERNNENRFKSLLIVSRPDILPYEIDGFSNDFSSVTNPNLTKFDFDLNFAVFGENKNITTEELKFKLYPKKKYPNFLFKKHNIIVEKIQKAYQELLQKYPQIFSIDTKLLEKVSKKYKEYVDCRELIEMYHGASAAAKGNFNFDGKAFAQSMTLKEAVSTYAKMFISVDGVKYYPLIFSKPYMLFCYHDNGCRKYKLIYSCSDYQSEVIIQKNELQYYDTFFKDKYVDHTEKTILAPGPDFMKRFTYYSNALGCLNASLENDLTKYFNL